MSLNIKNPETYRLVKELADLTGESMTTAVTKAVQERLERVRPERGRDVEAQVERILQLAAAIRDAAPPGWFDQDFDEMLYDDLGLPK